MSKDRPVWKPPVSVKYQQMGIRNVCGQHVKLSSKFGP